VLLENIKIDKSGLEILRSNKCCREVLRSKKKGCRNKKGCLERVSGNVAPSPPRAPGGRGGGAGARERGARKFFILFIIIKLEAAGVTKDYFGGILSSNEIYIYI
jgi:hypothetical protein